MIGKPVAVRYSVIVSIPAGVSEGIPALLFLAMSEDTLEVKVWTMQYFSLQSHNPTNVGLSISILVSSFVL